MSPPPLGELWLWFGGLAPCSGATTQATEVAVFVACSTLCFGRHSLSEAMRTIGELGFNKVDVVVSEEGPHLKPSEVAADPAKAYQQLKNSQGLSIAAMHIDFAADLTREKTAEQMKAMCRLARVLTAPLVSVAASPVGTEMPVEIERLTWLSQLATSEGVTLAIETKIGTLSENPAHALDLCRKVPNLSIALDPSDYLMTHAEEAMVDALYPYVQHVRLRDTNAKNGQFQVRIGQGQIEYGRIVSQLSRFHYQRLLSVDIRETIESDFAMPPEVRKLKFLLESLI